MTAASSRLPKQGARQGLVGWGSEAGTGGAAASECCAATMLPIAHLPSTHQTPPLPAPRYLQTQEQAMDPIMILALTPAPPELVRQLLASAPDPAAMVAATTSVGLNAVHFAAAAPGGAQVLRLLIDANPAAAAATTSLGDTPLHGAAGHGNVEAVRLLLEAAPSSASMANNLGEMPFEAIHWLSHGRRWAADGYNTALQLMIASGQPVSRLLRSLKADVPAALPLFAALAARYPLTPADWSIVPSPCPGLASSLPDVLARSPLEAAMLVAHLPADERSRLRTAALCLHRAQADFQVALPQPLVWRILAKCAK